MKVLFKSDILTLNMFFIYKTKFLKIIHVFQLSTLIWLCNKFLKQREPKMNKVFSYINYQRFKMPFLKIQNWLRLFAWISLICEPIWNFKFIAYIWSSFIPSYGEVIFANETALIINTDGVLVNFAETWISLIDS